MERFKLEDKVKFKLGDKAWYFYSQWHGKLNIPIDLELNYEILLDHDMVDLYNKADVGLFYKTKRAALNAMAKRLKEFVDDEPTDEE